MQINKAKTSCVIVSVIIHLVLLSSMSFYRRPIIYDKQETKDTILCRLVKSHHKPEDIRPKTPAKPFHSSAVAYPNNSAGDLILSKISPVDNKLNESHKRIFYPKDEAKPDRLFDNLNLDYSMSLQKVRLLVKPSAHLESNTKLSFNIVPLPRRKNGKVTFNEMLGYQQMVRQKINEQLVYPQLAKRSGIEGEVSVKFLILKDGQVGGINIVNSNYDILSRAAIKTIRQASPFLPLPEKLKQKELWLSLRLSFKLE